MDTPSNRIIILDDDPIVLNSLRRILERHYTVHAFLNSAEAEAYLDQNPDIDLFMSDEMMPDIRGSSFLLRIKQKYPGICTIILSGLADKADVARAVNEGGVYAFLFKPVDKEQLLRTIQNGIENKRMREQLNEKNRQLETAYNALMNDLKVAQYIQIGMLPKQLPMVSNLFFSATYLPSEIVGGDYYNLFTIDDENVGIFFSDVTGHGVSAAMMVVFLSGVLNLLRPHQIDGESIYMMPHKLMHLINNEFMKNEYKNTPEGETILIPSFYGVFNHKRLELTYCNAGHLPPLLIHHGDHSIEELPLSGGFPVGVIVNAHYETTTIQLQPGDELFFYSDGLIEAEDQEGKLFGRAQLLELLSGYPESDSMLDKIMDDFKQMNYRQQDDITMILMRVHV